MEVRLEREKELVSKEKEAFLEWKKVIESEYERGKDELNRDFKYVEDQLNYLEVNRNQFEQMERKLEKYS